MRPLMFFVGNLGYAGVAISGGFLAIRGVIGIGDIVIVGLGGEPFTDYGQSMRDAAKGKFAMTFCLTNGYQGYLPTAKAFEEGGYEAANSHFTPTLQAETVTAATKLIDQI